MKHEPDDDALLAAIAGGDARALGELYTRYRPRLWRYLWQQLDGDETAVEDALQDLFLAVWRAAGGFRGASRVSTWIFRIAHHQVLHRRRDLARRAEGYTQPLECRDEAGAMHVVAVEEASHEEEVIERLALDAALGRLSAKHREALELVYQQGFTLDEVAVILEVPAGTVKSRISYARRLLRQELADAAAMEERES